MSEETVLVLGASGTVGRRLMARLRDAPLPVRAASRTAVHRFDWGDRTTWEPVLSGVTRLYLLTPDGVPVDPAFVALAVDGGVRRIVLQSSGGIEVMGDERLMAAERTVRDSGAEWTVLRPGWFHQNFDEGFFRDAVLAGELAVPVGDTRQAFVDADDIATVAAATLLSDGHAGRSYELTGPRPLSFGEAVDVIGRAAGRKVRFDGTVEGYEAAHRAFGRSAAEVAAEVAAFTALAGEGDAVSTDAVRQVTGRPPISFEEFAEAAAARGAWAG